jgi:hypothetical protein
LSIAKFTSSVTLSSNLGSILHSSIYLNKKKHNYKCPGRKEKLVRLKTESIKAHLLDLSCQLSDDENDFIPKYRSYAFLREYEYHCDDEVKHDAKRILKRINDIKDTCAVICPLYFLLLFAVF